MPTLRRGTQPGRARLPAYTSRLLPNLHRQHPPLVVCAGQLSSPIPLQAARFSAKSLSSKLVNSMAAMDVAHPQTYQQRSSFEAAGPVRLCLVAAAWNACPCGDLCRQCLLWGAICPWSAGVVALGHGSQLDTPCCDDGWRGRHQAPGFCDKGVTACLTLYSAPACCVYRARRHSSASSRSLM